MRIVLLIIIGLLLVTGLATYIVLTKPHIFSEGLMKKVNFPEKFQWETEEKIEGDVGGKEELYWNLFSFNYLNVKKKIIRNGDKLKICEILPDMSESCSFWIGNKIYKCEKIEEVWSCKFVGMSEGIEKTIEKVNKIPETFLEKYVEKIPITNTWEKEVSKRNCVCHKMDFTNVVNSLLKVFEITGNQVKYEKYLVTECVDKEFSLVLETIAEISVKLIEEGKESLVTSKVTASTTKFILEAPPDTEFELPSTVTE
ncbi:MAG: hypothetical protein QXY24_03130 [Candidatus Aenigmatarchaeota archaeon]